MYLKNVILLCLLGVSVMTVQAKNIYGLYEQVILPEMDNVKLKAKLDTGALTSSLGATQIEFFKKGDNDWVRFKPQVKDMDLPVVEKEVVRHSKIKRRLADIREDDHDITHRPVVMLDICFDNTIFSVEVNLTDRSAFNYPLLLGSSALREFGAIVDPSLKFVSKAKCSPDTN